MLTVTDRIALAEQAHVEGRIIQNKWRKPSGDTGRELVCALAAFGPDINSSEDCPADLMPDWLAHLVPTLDDGLAAADVPWFMGELVSHAKRWSVLDTAAWARIKTGFLIGTVQQAFASAASVHTEPYPSYFIQVRDAVDGVIAVLKSGDSDAAAASAASAAADAAASAAARAASAADAAASAADAAASAADAASRQSCELLFGLIDAEIIAAE